MASLRIGDTVSVPGNMHGTLKYVGPVDGKRGTFAGVQLAPEFASRGKNSGDVEGKFYFRTTVPGSGIFLPAEKAEKRRSTPGTPGQALGEFNRGGRTPSLATAGQKPTFSQSVGPGALAPGTGGIAMRSGSPALKGTGPRRESLPRPSSPLRKAPMTSATQTPAAGRLVTPKTRPSLGFNKSAIGAPGIPVSGMRSPALRQSSSVATSKFGQSLRSSTRGAVTPGRMKAPGVARSDASLSTATTEVSPLGPESAFDEEEEIANGDGADSTPTPAAGRSFKKNGSPGDKEETRRLREQLAERDQQLNDQANSIREIEAELQQLMTAGGGLSGLENDDDLPKDVQSLRAALRDKNERIKALTAEFDANRADFRSTIDTLEMASTETERVYEKRVEELLEELRVYQEKNEDIESVAQQFEQLQELVQELEEGLEDARRGEAEARGEVEFLRGEVERSRSELRREKERGRAGDRLNGIETNDSGVSMEDLDELQLKLDQKDDEIRGLKAIVQNLNNSAAARSPDRDQTPRANGGVWGHGHSKTKSTNTVLSLQEDTAEHLQQHILDLESLLDSNSFSKDQLREEVSKLRQSVQFGTNGVKVNIPGLGISQHKRMPSDLQKHRSVGASSSASTARPGSFRSAESGSSARHPYQAGHKRKDTGVPEFVDAVQSPLREQFDEAYHDDPATPTQVEKSPTVETPSVSGQTDASSNAALWCEICEESGHDILTCSNMGFGTTNGSSSSVQQAAPTTTAPGASLRPLSGRDAVREGLRRSRDSPHPPPDTTAPPPPGPVSGDKDVERPAPLSMGSRSNSTYTITSPIKSKRNSASNSSAKRDEFMSEKENRISSGSTANTSSTTITKPKLIEGTGDQAGMLAGKESGIIDADKWCALCERDGHDSVDCPLEMGF